MEIERKYFLRGEPDGGLKAYPVYRLEQGYICKKPVIRLRHIVSEEGETFVLTVKSGGLTVRREFEVDLSKEEYDGLSSKVDGGIIRKDRYLVPLKSGLKAEVDVFLNEELAPLIIAEVEFPSVEAMEAFAPPAWFGKDVSDDPSYQNNSLVLRLQNGKA